MTSTSLLPTEASRFISFVTSNLTCAVEKCGQKWQKTFFELLIQYHATTSACRHACLVAQQKQTKSTLPIQKLRRNSSHPPSSY